MRKLFENILFPVLITLALFITPIVLSQSNEELLKFRNLQYEQAKRIVRMQDLRAEFDKLNIENEKIKGEMDNWIKEQAKKQNVDLTKYAWDSDQLKFVEIKKNEAKNTN